MADACNAASILVSITHGANPLNMACAFTWAEVIQDVVVRGEGVVGPTCRQIIARDITAVCEYLEESDVDPDDGPSNLVIVRQSPNGNLTTTLSNMVARGRSASMDRESGQPMRYAVSFVHKGTSANNQVSD